MKNPSPRASLTVFLFLVPPGVDPRLPLPLAGGSLLAMQLQSPPTGGQAPAPHQFRLEDGTPIKLRLSRTISSADAQVDERVDFEVLEEVKVVDTSVIPKGSVAWGTVTEAQPKRRMARGGKLDVNIDSVRLADGGRPCNSRCEIHAGWGGHHCGWEIRGKHTFHRAAFARRPHRCVGEIRLHDLATHDDGESGRYYYDWPDAGKIRDMNCRAVYPLLLLRSHADRTGQRYQPPGTR